MKKKLSQALIIIFLFLFSESNAQFLGCRTVKFSGSAPSPWAIDGDITDWETIFGAGTGDPIFPFGSPIRNGAYDSYGANDPDNPDPKSDIRALSTIRDDYNVFFYLRRIDNNNFPNKAFYFFDTNLDGLMNNGEPVLSVSFNSQSVHKLSMGSYISSNPSGDPIGNDDPQNNFCFVDGNSMKGRIEELFNSHNAFLMPMEIFSASITENGYGLEIAVPWRFISQYKYFTYHVALQKGAGTYDPQSPSDNAGGCSPYLNIVGDADFEVASSSVTTITPGSSYRIDLTFKNLTPASLRVDVSSFVSITNIIQQDNLSIDETQFSISVGSVNYSYFSGSFLNQPIIYSSILNPALIVLDPLATKTVSIFISFPPNNSVQSATFIFHPAGRFSLETECIPNVGGGGKPINPVGFTLSDEETETTTSHKNSQSSIEKNEQNKNILVYPNPSNGSMNVILPVNEGSFELILTDYTGRVIKKWSGIKQNVLKIENLKPGFYLLNINMNQTKEQVIKKIIIQ